ncbi:protein NEGATIVE GRAVITROPIC RESPONSE OF ROOTS isoform X2 [Spinacia oleracea]|uniref:Protein NEGATIVE GRAVITROPIC RESPONSE OF ROOTS isoform X2 n=1 Tax=Spinacia oleracea TaxID=3562 RepID=A0A9R0HS97_SPIOL|nr:protein NEGATIVE GRAVITROPIC RESPONSE OF ROOTS-like isoform X2 [Spinacia oleracea]
MPIVSQNQIFSWVHDKLNGRSQANNSNTNVYASNKNQTPQIGGQKEEFSDWPQGFLSIGTLFNKSSKDVDTTTKEKSPQNPILDFTLEEVKELQKELNALMSSNHHDCFSSFETCPCNKKGDDEGEEEDDEEEEEIEDQHDTTIVTNNKGKDVYLDNNGSKLIGKKSLSFLLKKAFICGVGGLGPTPSLKDPTLPVPKSRLSKILRAMLRKKIYPQSSCPTTTMSRKKCLRVNNNRQTGRMINYDDEDELDVEEDNRIKWDKSDTEYIVLEI